MPNNYIDNIYDEKTSQSIVIQDSDAQAKLAAIPSTTTRGMVMVDGVTIFADANGVISTNGTPGPTPEPTPQSNQFCMKFTITEDDITNGTNTINLPFIEQQAAMDVEVDWGDGSTNDSWNMYDTISAYPVHTYTEAGDYYVMITNNTDIEQHPDVEQCMPVFANGNEISQFEQPLNAENASITGDYSSLAGYTSTGYDGLFSAMGTIYTCDTSNTTEFTVGEEVDVNGRSGNSYFGVYNGSKYFAALFKNAFSMYDSETGNYIYYPYVTIPFSTTSTSKTIKTYLATFDPADGAKITKALDTYTIEPMTNTEITFDLSTLTDSGNTQYLIIESINNSTDLYMSSIQSAAKSKYLYFFPDTYQDTMYYYQYSSYDWTPSTGVQYSFSQNSFSGNSIQMSSYTNVLISWGDFSMSSKNKGCKNFIFDTSSLSGGTADVYMCKYGSGGGSYNYEVGPKINSYDLSETNCIAVNEEDIQSTSEYSGYFLINIVGAQWKLNWNPSMNCYLVNYPNSIKYNWTPYSYWRSALTKVVSPLLKMAYYGYDDNISDYTTIIRSNINSLFMFCEKLTSIPATLFSVIGSTLDDNDDYNGALGYMFSNSGLTSYPAHLLDASYFNGSVHKLNGFFSNSKISSVGTPLFAENDNLFYEFRSMFDSCPIETLETIDGNNFLFDLLDFQTIFDTTGDTVYFDSIFNTTLITSTNGFFYNLTSAYQNNYDNFSFSGTFANCENLCISSGDFYTGGTISNIEIFSGTYSRSSANSSAAGGYAPELWNMYSGGSSSNNYCFDGSGNNSSTLNNYSSIPTNWGRNY